MGQKSSTARPSFGSTQDGYAVVASDGPGDYEIAGEARAGVMDGLRVQAGTVAYITTGR